MNFIDLFTKNEYDNRPFLRKNGRDFTLKEIKKFAAFQREKFLKSDKENVVLFGDSNFDFMINFFGAVFAKASISLILIIFCRKNLKKHPLKTMNFLQ